MLEKISTGVECAFDSGRAPSTLGSTPVYLGLSLFDLFSSSLWRFSWFSLFRSQNLAAYPLELERPPGNAFCQQSYIRPRALPRPTFFPLHPQRPRVSSFQTTDNLGRPLSRRIPFCGAVRHFSDRISPQVRSTLPSPACNGQVFPP